MITTSGPPGPLVCRPLTTALYTRDDGHTGLIQVDSVQSSPLDCIVPVSS